MIILMLLTFTDISNVFANSIGLRVAFRGSNEISPNRISSIAKAYPISLADYHFEPNIARFIIYVIAGFLIINLVYRIEDDGDTSLLDLLISKEKLKDIFIDDNKL